MGISDGSSPFEGAHETDPNFNIRGWELRALVGRQATTGACQKEKIERGRTRPLEDHGERREGLKAIGGGLKEGRVM